MIAPAGSGKTRVLTERARLLQAGWGLPADAMTLVAYNVRAAGEMRSRLQELPSLRVRTLNALSLRLCGRADHHRGARGAPYTVSDWSSFPAGPRPIPPRPGSKR